MSSADRQLPADEIVQRPVRSRETVFTGHVWDVVRDVVDLGDAGEATREYVQHPGAVGCVALDADERVLLISQYRHPVGLRDWELPAGLLDVAGEPPWEACARELAEEADMRADEWHVLADWQNSPGGSSENWRCFLARGLHAVDTSFEREHEEAEIVVRWVPLEDCVTAALTGRLHNACTIAGVLAASAARDRGWATLRQYDAPWPEHPAYR